MHHLIYAAKIRCFWHSECYLDFSGFHAWETEGSDQSFKRSVKSHKCTHINRWEWSQSELVMMLSIARFSNQQLQECAGRKRCHRDESWDGNRNENLTSRSMKMFVCRGLTPDWTFLSFFSPLWFYCFYGADFKGVWHCLIGKAGRFMLSLLQAAVMISL